MVKTRGHAGQSIQHAVVNHGVSRCSLDGACSIVIPHFAQMRPSRGGAVMSAGASCQDRHVAGTLVAATVTANAKTQRMHRAR
jgi:hypothetical protein